MESTAHIIEEEEEEEHHHLPLMESGSDAVAAAEASLSTAWEWGNLLDFAIEEPSILSWDSDDRLLDPAPAPAPILQSQPTNSSSDRVRKRDPRLICENFLAGRVPCACPELDEMEEEEEEEEERIDKKRPRRTASLRAKARASSRCQVPGCGADIKELKGYHQRHKVCLRCASASAVVFDGQPMRYCQQCGKFHILQDFDEGKRSCRRKLERHNDRRRRKSNDNRSVGEKEHDGIFPADDVTCDDEVEREMLNGVASTTDPCLTNQLKDTETLFESEDGHGSAFCSVPSFQNTHGNGVASFVTSCETQMDEGKDYSKPSLSSSFSNNKYSYSSVCPTGRMSFKLYDWNPAEFPRRLRHQIFQWLANMPIELEGYIRPGCTILTLFIAMPQFMWVKLSEDALSYVSDLINAPKSLLSGRSTMRIYLNDMIFQVLKDGSSLINIKMEARMPRLHYVHPTYFEAGKPMEFVVCGNNLVQPKFRLLVSFAGKYLAYKSCLAIPPKKTRSRHVIESESTNSSDHEIFKIYIPSTELKPFGPVFIEVENESGLSNFIPVLIGDRQICSELQMLQQRFDKVVYSENIDTQFADTDGVLNSCHIFVSEQKAMSELLLDVAWLLKEPQLDNNEILLTSTQVQRFNCLLRFLIQNECISILERILQSLMNVMEAAQLYDSVIKTNDADLRSFQKYMVQAKEILHQKLQRTERSVMQSDNCSQLPPSDIKSEMIYTLPHTNQGGMDSRMEDGLLSTETSASQGSDIHVPLVNKEIVMDVNHCPRLMNRLEWPQKASAHIFSSSIKRSRLVVLSMAAVAVCFGICIAFSHPHEVQRLAVSVRRCLFGDFMP